MSSRRCVGLKVKLEAANCQKGRDEASASPDEEVYRAIKPGMATLPGGMLIGISTPYRKAGLLFKGFEVTLVRQEVFATPAQSGR